MLDTTQMIGITDTGQPLVMAEHTCKFWLPGKVPEDKSKICWHCRYADFRKTSEMILFQSPCHCPHNQVRVIKENKNETQEREGGAKE